MKKVLTTVLFSAVVLGGAVAVSQSVSADGATPTVTQNLKSEGSIKYFPDKHKTDPLDPDDPDPDNPLDPDNPDPDGPDPEPGTDGPLSLDYVPDLYFGLNKISEKDEIYNAYALPTTNESLPIYAQVTDERGTSAGWTLTVAETDQFKSDSGATLGDATTISLIDQKVKGTFVNAKAPSKLADTFLTVKPDNAAHVVFAAAAGEGEGTWESKWGNVSQEKRYVANTDPTKDPTEQEVDVDTAVQLMVPGNVKKMAERYVTNLDWTLTDVPYVAAE